MSAQRFCRAKKDARWFVIEGSELLIEDDDAQRIDIWAQARVATLKREQLILEKEQREVQESARGDASPWLRRTQWLEYFKGCDRKELFHCTAEPDAKDDDIGALLWEATDELMNYCQQTVVRDAGVMMRLEAIRSEKNQNRYAPLQSYMDSASRKTHSLPWKQMMMFFYNIRDEDCAWKRPKCKFTKSQKAAWKALYAELEKVADDDDVSHDNGGDSDSDKGEDGDDEKRPPLKAIPQKILAFVITLLDQQQGRHEYQCALTCASAVLGISEDSYLGADRYPPILSRIIKFSRFMVIQAAIDAAGPDSDSDSERSSSQDTPPARPAAIHYLRDMMDRFMIRGSLGPMDWLLSLRTYGLKIHFTTTAEGHITWSHGHVLGCGDKQMSMAQFRGMIHGLVRDVRQTLMEELLFLEGERGLPVIPWDELRDNPINTETRWSFLKDVRNPWPVDGNQWLWDRIGASQQLKARFVRNKAGRMIWNRPGVESYLAHLLSFRSKVLVLMHLAGGQPARGPEILSICHRNTVNRDHRNVFIEDGLVVFVTRDHKGYNTSGLVKIIHRYLPREVGELLVYYLWLVLPFWEHVEGEVWQKERVSSNLWPADPAGKEWTSERFRKSLQSEFEKGVGQSIGIAVYRVMAIAISRHFLNTKAAFKTDDDDEDGDWNEDADTQIADEQAGHSPHIAGMIYARGITEADGVVASKRLKYRGYSEE